MGMGMGTGVLFINPAFPGSQPLVVPGLTKTWAGVAEEGKSWRGEGDEGRARPLASGDGRVQLNSNHDQGGKTRKGKG